MPYVSWVICLGYFTGLIESGSEEEAWSRQKNIYFSASGRSFHEHCFPRNSVHIGISANAVHYLSKRYVDFWALSYLLFKITRELPLIEITLTRAAIINMLIRLIGSE